MADFKGPRSIEVAAQPEHCFAIAADLDQDLRVSESRNDTRWRSPNAIATDRDVINSQIDATVARVQVRLRFGSDEPLALQSTQEGPDESWLVSGPGPFRSAAKGWRFTTYAAEDR